MNHNIPVTTIILAGGKSSRFGEDKALFEIRGKKIIEYVFDEICPFSDEIIISANSDSFDFFNVRVVNDEFSEIGPASGIYSGLKHSSNEINLVVSGDTPLLKTPFFAYLIAGASNYDITIPFHDNVLQPITGVFKKPVFKDFGKAINNQIFSPADIIKSLNYQYLNIDNSLPFYHPEMFRSLNTKDDIEIISELLGL